MRENHINTRAGNPDAWNVEAESISHAKERAEERSRIIEQARNTLIGESREEAVSGGVTKIEHSPLSDTARHPVRSRTSVISETVEADGPERNIFAPERSIEPRVTHPASALRDTEMTFAGPSHIEADPVFSDSSKAIHPTATRNAQWTEIRQKRLKQMESVRTAKQEPQEMEAEVSRHLHSSSATAPDESDIHFGQRVSSINADDTRLTALQSQKENTRIVTATPRRITAFSDNALISDARKDSLEKRAEGSSALASAMIRQTVRKGRYQNSKDVVEDARKRLLKPDARQRIVKDDALEIGSTEPEITRSTPVPGPDSAAFRQTRAIRQQRTMQSAAATAARTNPQTAVKAQEDIARTAKTALDRITDTGDSIILDRMQEASATMPDTVGALVARTPRKVSRIAKAGAVAGFAGSVLNRGLRAFGTARAIAGVASGDSAGNETGHALENTLRTEKNIAEDTVRTAKRGRTFYTRMQRRKLLSAGAKAKAAKMAAQTSKDPVRGLKRVAHNVQIVLRRATEALNRLTGWTIGLILLVIFLVILFINVFSVVASHQNELKAMFASRSSTVMASGGTADAVLYHALKNAGYSDEMIAGMLGNFNTETSGGDSGRGTIDPSAVQSNGEGHGIAQWSYGRKDNLMQYAAETGPNHSTDDWSNIAVQVNFLLKELAENGYSGTFLNFSGRPELQQEAAAAIASSDLGNPPSSDARYDLVNQCALEWEHVFERSSYAPSFDERIADAQYFYDKILSGAYEGFDLESLALPISLDGFTITTAPTELEDSSEEPADDSSRVYWHPERHGTGQGLGQYHVGVDITNNNSRARAHEIIQPVAYGNGTRVADAGVSDGYGNYVVTMTELNDGNTLYVLYAHCDSVLVSTGDMVEQTTQLATVGSTGHSTGDHLHLALKLNANPVEQPRYNAENAIDANWLWSKQGYSFPHGAIGGWDYDANYSENMREYVKDEIMARFGGL